MEFFKLYAQPLLRQENIIRIVSLYFFQETPNKIKITSNKGCLLLQTHQGNHKYIPTKQNNKES